MEFYCLSGIGHDDGHNFVTYIPIFTDGEKFYRQREVGFNLDVLCYHLLMLLPDEEMITQEIEAFYRNDYSLADPKVRYECSENRYPLEVIPYDIRHLIRYKKEDGVVVQENLKINDDDTCILAYKINGVNYVGDVDYFLELIDRLKMDKQEMEVIVFLYSLYSRKKDYRACLRLCCTTEKQNEGEDICNLWRRRANETRLLMKVEEMRPKEKEVKKYGFFRKK